MNYNLKLYCYDLVDNNNQFNIIANKSDPYRINPELELPS